MSKKTYYRIHNLLKLAEEDIYDDGCQPETAQTFEVSVEFQGKTAKEVVQSAADWLGVSWGGENNGVEVNAADEPGRVDFRRMEDDESGSLSPRKYAAWKNGQCKAWAVTYTGYVRKVTEETVKL